MQLGLCTDPTPIRRHKEAGTLDGFWNMLTNAGVAYLEFPVNAVMRSEVEFEQVRELMAASPLPVPAFNGFLPAAQRITGPEVDLQSVLDYCRIALTRCRALNGDVVVLGSAGARRVPDGFDFGRAEKQFCEFGRALGPIADEIGIDIAIEPLNSQEDNLILSVSQGARVMDEINHPRIRLLADFYHMIVENEPVSAVRNAGARLRHTHLADIGRVAPGYAPEGEADFVGFFQALQESGYTQQPYARCSFEGKLNNMETQIQPMMRLLQTRWQQSIRELTHR